MISGAFPLGLAYLPIFLSLPLARRCWPPPQPLLALWDPRKLKFLAEPGAPPFGDPRKLKFLAEPRAPSFGRRLPWQRGGAGGRWVPEPVQVLRLVRQERLTHLAVCWGTGSEGAKRETDEYLRSDRLVS